MLVTLNVEIPALDRLAHDLHSIVELISASRFTYTIKVLEDDMPTYKADRLDFDAAVKISAKDSEGNVIPDISVPAGHSLTVSSDNPSALTATQDIPNSKLVHYHVGGPNADGTPATANVSATLTDSVGNVVAADTAVVTVTAGDAETTTGISLGLPEA
jgi:hypothetical protein